MADETVNQSSPLDDERLDESWRAFLASPPMANGLEDVKEAEQQIVDEGLLRRMLLATMQFGGEELYRKSQDDDAAKVLAMSIAAGKYWKSRTIALLELADAQLLRLRMALCERHDMDELLAQAESELFEETP